MSVYSVETSFVFVVNGAVVSYIMRVCEEMGHEL